MQETGSLCSPWMVQPALLITCPANPGAQHQLTLNTHLQTENKVVHLHGGVCYLYLTLSTTPPHLSCCHGVSWLLLLLNFLFGKLLSLLFIPLPLDVGVL